MPIERRHFLGIFAAALLARGRASAQTAPDEQKANWTAQPDNKGDETVRFTPDNDKYLFSSATVYRRSSSFEGLKLNPGDILFGVKGQYYSLLVPKKPIQQVHLPLQFNRAKNGVVVVGMSPPLFKFLQSTAPELITSITNQAKEQAAKLELLASNNYALRRERGRPVTAFAGLRR